MSRGLLAVGAECGPIKGAGHMGGVPRRLDRGRPLVDRAAPARRGACGRLVGWGPMAIRASRRRRGPRAGARDSLRGIWI